LPSYKYLELLTIDGILFVLDHAQAFQYDSKMLMYDKMKSKKNTTPSEHFQNPIEKS